jgi:KipI family sensor histidine kinase inhibitor
VNPLPPEPLGDQALLLRWGGVADAETNRCVHAFAARLRAARPSWLVDLVPAYASLAVFFDGEVERVREALLARDAHEAIAEEVANARLVEIPVAYGGEHGPDIGDVGNACGLTPAQVVERHAQVDYLVAMLGFSPGFPYLLGLDPQLAVPRLSTPRTRVPAGSVGIGGAQTGVYPNEGPGGWRLIGRTDAVMFDARREPASLLLPGDRVRFVPVASRGSGASREASSANPHARVFAARAAPTTGIEVIAPGLLTTVQDLGRFGHRHLGVGTAGALDAYSLRVANLLVGNDDDCAALESTLQGPRLRLRNAARIAITGADIDAHVDGVAIPGWRPVDVPAGSELVLGPCRRGARAYLAVAGGLDAERLLGSRSTDLRAGLGRALVAGDVIATHGEVPADALSIARWWIDPHPDLDFAHPQPIRVLPGHDAPAPGDALFAQAWRVTAQSNRQGLRLQGDAMTLADPGERISEPVAPGTIQLPLDGQPIVLLAEAQTVGGYPRIGHVITADLPRLAQRRPGESVTFVAVDADEAHAAACAQRHRLTRIGMAISQRLQE